MTVYLDYFGLQQAPFSITPDPGYVYLSRRHEEALAHLLYGIGRGGSGGFVQLTGEVGTGKTTLCRCLLEQIPENTHIALILNPMLSPLDLLQAICDELGIEYQRDFSSRELVNALNAFLLQAHGRGERVVLVIDEAQNLQPQALEQVRLLTNLETHTDKLLQIILLGQPELRELLASAGLRQLAQRITARYHLQPLDEAETVAYVKHRLSVAGRHQPLFTRDGYRALFRLSGGVPRLINIYADRALMGAYARDAEKITGSTVRQACQEVGHSKPASGRRFIVPGVVASALLLSLMAFWWLQTDRSQQASPDAALNVTAPPIVDAGESGAAAAAVSAAADAIDDPARQVTAVPVAEQTAADEHSPADNTELTLDAWLQQGQATGIWRRWAQVWGSDAALLQTACAEEEADLASPDRNAPASTLEQSTQGADESAFFCTTLYGNWGRIRQLQLPVVLLLQAAGSNAGMPVLVENLGASEATLSNGVTSRVMPVQELSPWWQNGQFTAVCPGRAQAWTLGDSSADISRLKQQAARLALQPFAGSIDMQYDQEFADWVGRYQLRNGLQVDRVLGRDTRLFLCAESQANTSNAVMPANQKE
jgi:type II secretory pathway predicted ATPase ExeA